jgi:hypothetical protein
MPGIHRQVAPTAQETAAALNAFDAHCSIVNQQRAHPTPATIQSRQRLSKFVSRFAKSGSLHQSANAG